MECIGGEIFSIFRESYIGSLSWSSHLTVRISVFFLSLTSYWHVFQISYSKNLYFFDIVKNYKILFESENTIFFGVILVGFGPSFRLTSIDPPVIERHVWFTPVPSKIVWAGNFWFLDIGVNAWSTLFLNLEIN